MVERRQSKEILIANQMSFPEGNPRQCDRFPHHEGQMFYWRAFTEKGIRSFIQTGFQSTVPLDNVATEAIDTRDDGAMLIPSNRIEVPGALWTSPDPEFALVMGLSRAVMENQKVYLLGVNHCMHEEDVTAYRVFSEGKKHRSLYPVRHDSSDKRIFFSSGTIFDRFTPHQVANGVLYTFAPGFVDAVGSVVDKIDASELLAEKHVSRQIAYVLGTTREELGAYDRLTQGNHLVESDMAFLVPAQVDGLTTRDMADATLAVGHDLETATVQDVFMRKLEKESEQTHLKTAEQVLVSNRVPEQKRRKVGRYYIISS